MLGVIVRIDGHDPVAGAPVTLRAASHDDMRVCHLDGQDWWPVIAKLPTLRYDLFDGSFGGGITAPSSSLTIGIEPWPALPRYMLADARFRLWTGEVGAAWTSWTLRFDGRVTAQPQSADGRADIAFAVDDRWLDGPLLAAYAGTTGAEGPASLKGQVKPLAIGAPRYVAGTLVDVAGSVFQLSNGPINDVPAALERLARYGASAGDYPGHAALVAAAIPAGRWATAKAAGLARFGAPPTGKVSFLVQGDAGGADGWIRRPGRIVARLATLSGGAGRIDAASLAALDAARPYNLSLNLTAQTTARDTIQRVAASVNAVAGVSWLGKLFVAPVGLGAPALTLAADGSALPPVASVTQVPGAAPWWRLAIGAERTETVHQLGDVAFYGALIDLGAYDPGRTYREGNIVQYQGSSWVYINPVATAGNAPPTLPTESNAWWRVLARAGVDGADGADGTAGAPGANGVDGATLYTWVAYADTPDGSVNFTLGAPGARGFQGTAINRTTASESINPADYAWAPYRGPALFGLVARGNCVVGPDYALKNGGAAAWDSDVYSDVTWTGGCQLSFRAGQTNAQIMMGINTDPATNADYVSIDHAFFLADDGHWEIWEDGAYVIGATGTVYATTTVFQIIYDGRRVTYLTDGIPVRVVPVAAGRAFYLDSSFAYPGARIDRISWSAMGAAGGDGVDGVDGTNGLPGPPGTDGTTLYTWIAYANAADGSVDFTIGGSAGRAYIGIANNRTTATEGTDPAAYTWSLIRGTDGVPGTPGADGSPTYTWFAYADAADGSANFTTGSPDGRLYIGIAPNKPTPGESSNPADYAWTRLRGADGATGAPGANALSVAIAPPTTTIGCDAAGIPRDNQFPRSAAVAVISGTLNVTNSSVFHMSATGCYATLSGSGVVTVTGITDETAYVDVTAEYGGGAATQRFTLSKVRDATPNQAKRYTGGPATVSATTYGSSNFGPAEIIVGPNGTISASVLVAWSAGTATNMAAKVQYREKGTSTWIDLGAEQIGEPSSAGTAGEPGNDGQVSTTRSASGPAELKVYEFQLQVRKHAGADKSVTVTLFCSWAP
ncbi:hypothetical protein [Sphingomonas profundi]|uniref:hypothetical protein n=1 Tax=Alterirhizorhabdus profundi TaxID=2681549 RepID=UPI0012E862D2|nr:hypothetical protein [Sphingomonas profundi]